MNNKKNDTNRFFGESVFIIYLAGKAAEVEPNMTNLVNLFYLVDLKNGLTIKINTN